MMRILSTLLLIILTGSSFVVSGQNNYELLYLEGDYDDILVRSEQLNNPEDYYWNALIKNKQGEQLLALETLEQGISEYPDRERLELLLTDIYYETGNYLKAKPLLKKYSASKSKFIRLVDILEFEDSYEEAIDLLEKRLESDSLDLTLLIYLGDIHFQNDSIKNAITYYEKVYQLNPDDQATANKLASLLIKVKEYERSIEICDSILWKDPVNKKFIRIKASASFSNKDYSSAQAYFKSLFAMGDSGAFVMKHLGISEFHLQWNKESRKHLLSAYDRNPNDFETCFMLGRGFLNSPTPQQGLPYLERADSLLMPDSIVIAAIYNEKRSIYYTIGDFDRTLECYKKAYEYDPQPKYFFYMASLYQYTFKEKELALEYYKRFLDMLGPPISLADNPDLEGQMTITMRSAAESAVTELREALFFEGKLKE